MTGRAKRGLAIALSLLTLGGTAFMVWRMVVTRSQARHVQRAADAWTAYRTCLLGKDADTDAPRSALLAREVATNQSVPGWPEACRAHLEGMAKALAQLPDSDPRLATLRDKLDAVLHAATPVSPALDELWLAAKILPTRGPEAPGAGPPAPAPAAPKPAVPAPPPGADVALVGRPTPIEIGDELETSPETSAGMALLGDLAACWISSDHRTVPRCASAIRIQTGVGAWLATTADPARLLAFDGTLRGHLIDLATGKPVLDGTLSAASVLADGTVAAVRRIDAGGEELVRIGAGGAIDRTGLPAHRGDASLVADELVWTDTRGHLVTRHVTPAGTPPGPVVDHGEGGGSLYRGCRTAHGLAVAAERPELRDPVMHTDVRVVFRDGDTWSAPVTGETSWRFVPEEPSIDRQTTMRLRVGHHLHLTCEDDALVYTSAVAGRVEELRCTKAGCTHARSGPLTDAPPTDADAIVATHVGHDVLLARIAALPGLATTGQTLTLRIRRAPLARLADAPETVIATDRPHRGWLARGQLRLLSDGKRAVLLVMDSGNVGAITIDGAGHASPVTAPRDPMTAPE